MRYVLGTPPNPQPLPLDDQREGERVRRTNRAILFWRALFGRGHGMPCPYLSERRMPVSGNSPGFILAYLTERGDSPPRVAAR